MGLVLFLAFTVYTIPYMVQGVEGASLVLAQASDGAIEPWLGLEKGDHGASVLRRGGVRVVTARGE